MKQLLLHPERSQLRLANQLVGERGGGEGRKPPFGIKAVASDWEVATRQNMMDMSHLAAGSCSLANPVDLELIMMKSR